MSFRASTSILLALIVLAPALEIFTPIATAPPTQAPTQSARDDRLRPLMRAADTWRRRSGPTRQVVDVVVLVPDEAAWLAALSTWDRQSWFPVLIEDVEYTLKFLRAFRPARVLRYRGPAIPRSTGGDQRWAAVLGTLGQTWDVAGSSGPLANRQPLDDGPPGVVIAHPQAESLLGAVALAAGRFQPLLRVDPPPGLGYGNIASTAEALELARKFQLAVMEAVPAHEQLADDCDFITIAGNYPYKYEGGPHTTQPGLAAFDDLVGRNLSERTGTVLPRWAYTGRLLGNPTVSVYRAMCSLFLPEAGSAVLINGYSGGHPWIDYDTVPAAETLAAKGVDVTNRRGDVPTLHATFDPVNRAPLVFLNSSGSPTAFNLNGQPAHSGDLPRTVPTAVHMVHSYSAADPRDPQTIAGRWLANGAFVYFGSVNEPYLVSFRSPALVADLIARGLPLSAAVRLTPEELPPMGNAWRLAYLGDPLFKPRVGPKPPLGRLEDVEAIRDWPASQSEPAPPDSQVPATRLAWALQVAIDDARSGRPPGQALADVLGSLPRDSLSRNEQEILDALIVDTWMEAGRPTELVARMEQVEPASRPPAFLRWLETARVVTFQRALADNDWPTALAAWARVAAEPSSNQDLRETVTRRIVEFAKEVVRKRELVSAMVELTQGLPKGSPMIGFLREQQKKLGER